MSTYFFSQQVKLACTTSDLAILVSENFQPYACTFMLYSSRTSSLKISCLLFNFLLSLTGCPVGNILAIPITGMLAKYGFDGGWPSVFYCFGKQLQLHKSALLACRRK